MKYLAFVNVDRKFEKGKVYFKYANMKIYELKDFATFLKLIEKGKIEVGLTISIFKSGKRIGQIHDHGTRFCIKSFDLDKLFTEIIDSEK